MDLSWSALWLLRILFFDFDVLRFGCAMDFLLCRKCLENRYSEFLLQSEFIMISTIFQYL